MGLRIRLRQMGKTNHRTYRLVVTDVRSARDGEYVELLGSYDPHLKRGQEGTLLPDRINFWLERGAQLSEKAEQLVGCFAPEVIKQLREKERVKRIKAAKKSRARKQRRQAKVVTNRSEGTGQ